MIKTWNGPRRVAFIPVWNRQVDIEPPEDWIEQVQARVFFDPDSTTGIDGSLQNYIQTVSSGKAFIEGNVLPVVASEDADTVGAGLQSLPNSHGYDHAVIVLPHSMGQHRGGFAWWHAEPVKGITEFCRVAVFDNNTFSTKQNIGVWAMELLHSATHFGDLYNVSPQLGRFDAMGCACGTHPSTHTKSKMGWLNDNVIRNHTLRTTNNYTLHAVSLTQPPPPWRSTAIRIKSKNTTGHFLVECRLGTDIFDSDSSISDGIPSEGIIVYEVQGDLEVFLRTPVALKVGEKFEDSSEELKINVTSEKSGGFTINVESKGPNKCTQLADKIKSIRSSLEIETDLQRKKQLISALVRAQAELRASRCLILENPATEAFLG